MRRIVFIAVTSALAFGQTSPDGVLSFEAASVKPDDMSVPRMYGATCQGGPASRFKDYFYCTDATAAIMAMAALDIQWYQLPGGNSDAGPRFEVNARVANGATREQVRIMFLNFLKERFHFAYHFEKREMPVSTLTKIGNGPKLRPSSFEPLPPEDFSTTAAVKKRPGPPPLSRGNFSGSNTITGAITYQGNGVPLDYLISTLSRRLGRKIIDSTELTGNFEFSFSFKDDLTGSQGVPFERDPRTPAGVEFDAPDLATALKEQLGFKLTTGKALVDVLIIDHFDKAPTAN